MLAAALLLAAAAPAQAAKIERLSRSGKTSYFAFVDRAESARAKPSTSARKVAKLTLRTPEATDDLVLVLDRTEARGRDVAARAAAGPAERHHRLGAGVGAQRAAAGDDVAADRHAARSGPRWSRAARRCSARRIGVGQPQWPTPRGQFYIRAKLKGYGWRRLGLRAAGVHHERDVADADRLAGRRASSASTARTCPGLIPGRISHGCVRLRNADILRLAKLMPVGTPLTIT